MGDREGRRARCNDGDQDAHGTVSIRSNDSGRRGKSSRMFLPHCFGPADVYELANGKFNADVNAITWIVSHLRDIREWPSTIGGQP